MIDSLTAHERAIAECISEGLDNKNISRIFNVKPRTIAAYVLIIAGKLEKPDGYSARVWIARAIWGQHNA